MSVDFYRESPGKFDSRTLNRKTLNRWTGRSQVSSCPVSRGACRRIEAKPEAVTWYCGCISCEWYITWLNVWENRNTCYGMLADLGGTPPGSRKTMLSGAPGMHPETLQRGKCTYDRENTDIGKPRGPVNQRQETDTHQHQHGRLPCRDFRGRQRPTDPWGTRGWTPEAGNSQGFHGSPWPPGRESDRDETPQGTNTRSSPAARQWPGPAPPTVCELRYWRQDHTVTRGVSLGRWAVPKSKIRSTTLCTAERWL